MRTEIMEDLNQTEIANISFNHQRIRPGNKGKRTMIQKKVYKTATSKQADNIE